MAHRFRQVDVFGTEPLTGNPLAVVHDARDIVEAGMQQLARWTNLSETAFLLPPTTPEAEYRVRIFTTTRELPFAGHPTLGSAHAWLEDGGRPRDPGSIVQECGTGLVRLRDVDGVLSFAAPPLLRSGPVADADLARVTDALGINSDEVVDAVWADNGPGWIAVLLRDADAVLALDPRGGVDPAGPSLDVGVVGPADPAADHAFEVRAVFSDDSGALREDPVTGSLNAALGQWLIGSGRAPTRYVARQGTRLGRRGRVQVEQDGDTVWVGGRTTTVITGSLEGASRH